VTFQDILKTYEQMGIGTQEERDRFLEWNIEQEKDTSRQIFIVELPNSITHKDEPDAELA
jgi:hypothetical protein